MASSRRPIKKPKKTEAEAYALSGRQVCEAIRERTDKVFLGFSCGKDSLSAYYRLLEYFDVQDVTLFYMWLVPGLEFVERSLTYYEERFGVEIHRLPHPSVYRMLNNLVYQSPERIRTIFAAGFPVPEYDTVVDFLAEDLGFEGRPWTATGVRAADSPTRRANIRQHGAINENRRTFFPVWDQRIAELRESMAAGPPKGPSAAGAGGPVKLPIDYRLFGRSFDGIDRRFLEPMRAHLPADYQRILDLYPLADADVARREFAFGEHPTRRRGNQ